MVTAMRAHLSERADYCPTPPGPTAKRRANRWYKFGITEERYAAMLEECRHRCGKPSNVDFGGRTLVVDHDRVKSKGAPGFVRGLLCNTRNRALGVLGSRAWWEQATAYLGWAHPLAQQLLAAHPFPGRRTRDAVGC